MVYLLYRIIATIMNVYFSQIFRNLSWSQKVKMAKAYIH